MKKRSLILLALCLLMLMLASCTNQKNTEQTTAPTEEVEPGTLYLLNTETALEPKWQALADAYEAATGTHIKIVTRTVLPDDLSTAKAPTILCGSDLSQFEKLESQLLDLGATDAYKEMVTGKYNLNDGSGRVLGMAYHRECWGLLVNRDLLEKAGYSLEELMDFGMLSMIAAGIHGNSGTLGFDAFCPLSAAEAEVLAAQLANAALYYELRDAGDEQLPDSINGSYTAAARNFFDLMKENGGTVSDSGKGLDQFAGQKAVFLPAGTAELAALAERGMNPDTLAMLPLYCGIEGEEDLGFWEAPMSRWAVNACADRENIDAALDFLHWAVTDPAGTQILVSLQDTRLFRQIPGNEEDPIAVHWMPAVHHLPKEWLDTTVLAMTDYLLGKNRWEDVQSTCVESWKH